MADYNLISMGLNDEHVERDNSVLKKGVHLRWDLPENENYPANGFSIWRADYGDLNAQSKYCWPYHVSLPEHVNYPGLMIENNNLVFAKLNGSAPEGLLLDNEIPYIWRFYAKDPWRVEIDISALGGGNIEVLALSPEGYLVDKFAKNYPMSFGGSFWCGLLKRIPNPCCKPMECCNCFGKLLYHKHDCCKDKEKGNQRKPKAPPKKKMAPRNIPDNVKKHIFPERLKAAPNVVSQNTRKNVQNMGIYQNRLNFSESLKMLWCCILCWLVWIFWAIIGILRCILQWLCLIWPNNRLYREKIILHGACIDKIKIKANDVTVHEICYYPKDERRTGEWIKLDDVNWPTTVNEVRNRLAEENLPAYINNVWMDSAKIQEFLATLTTLRAQANIWTFNEDIPSGQEEIADLNWNPWSFLAVLALRPFFARLLGLGYIDSTTTADSFYLYKIINNDTNDEGVLELSLTRPYRSLDPVLDERAEKIRMGRFASVYRSGLFWDLPAVDEVINTDAHVMYNIFAKDFGNIASTFDVSISDLEWKNDKEPVLVNRESALPITMPQYLDQEIYQGQVAYIVEGLDIFGRHSIIDNNVWLDMRYTKKPNAPQNYLSQVIQEENPNLSEVDSLIATPTPGTIRLTWLWNKSSYIDRPNETVRFYPLTRKADFPVYAIELLSFRIDGEYSVIETDRDFGAENFEAWSTIEVNNKKYDVFKVDGFTIWTYAIQGRPNLSSDEPTYDYLTVSSPLTAILHLNQSYVEYFNNSMEQYAIEQHTKIDSTCNQTGMFVVPGSGGERWRIVETGIAESQISDNHNLGHIYVDDGGDWLGYEIKEQEIVAGKVKFKVLPESQEATNFVFAADQAFSYYPGYGLVIPLQENDIDLDFGGLGQFGILKTKSVVVASNYSSSLNETVISPTSNVSPLIWLKYTPPEAPEVPTVDIEWASRPDFYETSKYQVLWTKRNFEKYFVYRATEAALLREDFIFHLIENIKQAKLSGRIDSNQFVTFLGNSSMNGVEGIATLRQQAQEFHNTGVVGPEFERWLIIVAEHIGLAAPFKAVLNEIVVETKQTQASELKNNKKLYLKTISNDVNFEKVWVKQNKDPIDDDKYTDTFIGANTSWQFYKLKSIDSAKNISPEYSPSIGPIALLNTTPPKAPTLEYEVTDRKVSLRFKDLEKDIISYKVYRTDDMNKAKDFRRMGKPIVEVPGTKRQISDSVTPGKTYFYKIVSQRKINYQKDGIDRELFIDSRSDEFLTVDLISKEPPTPPKWGLLIATPKGFHLDILFATTHRYFLIQKRRVGKTIWATIRNWDVVNDASFQFIDESFPANGRYEYRVLVKDATGKQNVDFNIYIYDHGRS